MTTKILTIDDLDDSENAITIRFAFGDTTYEVDLAAANREKLESALAPFIQVAREVAKRPGMNGQAGLIREWAKARGMVVPAKGRVPVAITAQYEAEHASNTDRASDVGRAVVEAVNERHSEARR